LYISIIGSKNEETVSQDERFMSRKLILPLPKKVDSDKGSAKWLAKEQALQVELPVLE
jgi:hypothetical protein